MERQFSKKSVRYEIFGDFISIRHSAQLGASYSSSDRCCLQMKCVSLTSPQGVCVDNEENITLAIDLSSGESKTKKNGSRKTLNVGKSLHSNSRKSHR